MFSLEVYLLEERVESHQLAVHLLEGRSLVGHPVEERVEHLLEGRSLVDHPVEERGVEGEGRVVDDLSEEWVEYHHLAVRLFEGRRRRRRRRRLVLVLINALVDALTYALVDVLVDALVEDCGNDCREAR